MDGVITAKRKKPPKEYSHTEIHAGRGNQLIVEQHFTDAGHEPKRYALGKPARGSCPARSVARAAAGDAIRLARSSGDSLSRRKQEVGFVADMPRWQKRGLFKPGFSQGPRLKGAKLFTKGKGRP